MKYLRALTQFYLYSHLHIAICALCLTVFSQLAIIHTIEPVFTSFVFAGTLCQYAIHRLIGMYKLENDAIQGRYAVIHKFKSHISFYALLAGLASVYYFYHLDYQKQLWSIAPLILSAAYVLPILPKAQRLRDLPYLKIFLIAICWTFFTLIIPLQGLIEDSNLIGLGVERLIFIFAITIPFDIRDRQIDDNKGLSTIATTLGIKHAQTLSYILLTLAGGILLYFKYVGIIGPYYFFPLGISYTIALLLISFADKQRTDSYFTGWIDGVMILPLVLCLLANYFL